MRAGARGIFIAIVALVAGRACGEEFISADSFSQFSDEQMSQWIGQAKSPGAAVVLVEDGTIAFARGYGTTRIGIAQAVDPLSTAFRVGSISKLITATALLQLVERGKLRLHDDIQPHLPDIPLGAAGAGVTLHHLMTHTDGFDVGWSIGGAVRDERDAVPLAAFLQGHRPVRILQPGRMYVYSDVGMALGGHMVEDADGRSFAQYTREEIFTPLGMTRSTFEQSLPPATGERLATGYRKFHGAFHEMPPAHVLPVPSAGLTTTGGDMARLMIACLHRGELDGRRILKPETADLMRGRQFSHHPALPGTAYGLYEHVKNGQTALQHGGVMPGYHSLLLLFPQHDLGLFVATNAYGDESFDPLIDAFFDRFFPPVAGSTAEQTSSAAAPAGSSDVTGRYRYVQYPHQTLGKLSILAGLVDELRIRQQPDGTILVDQGLKGPWHLVARNLYARGQEKLAFQQDAGGSSVGLVYDTWAFERIRWYEARRVQILLIAAMCAMFLVSLITSIIRRLRVRESGARFSRALLTNLHLHFTTTASALNLAMLATLAYAIWHDDVFQWYYGLPRIIRLITCIPWISAAFTLAAIVISVQRWRRRFPRMPGEILHCLILASLVTFPVFCWYWNLIAAD